MAARRLCAFGFYASALLAWGALGSCAEDGVSLHVVCPVQPTIEENVCIYDEASETCVLQGVLNLAATQRYQESFRVQSGLFARAREVPPRGEPNALQIQGAQVELRTTQGQRLTFNPDAQGNRVPNPFNVSASGFVEPEGAGITTVLLVTPAHAAQLRDTGGVPTPSEIVIAVKLKARTIGRQSVTAGEFLWPVRLISRSPDPAVGECIPMDYCAESLGQDNFASACDQ